LANISRVTEIISDERLRKIERAKSTAGIYWHSQKMAAKSTLVCAY
jgi:hypothetical protein